MIFTHFYFIIVLTIITNCKAKLTWKEKDIMDYNEADFNRLSDQWEIDDDPLEPDEFPEHLRAPTKIDLSKFDLTNPDSVLEVSQQGKTVMMFIDVKKDLSNEEADNALRIWQGSLRNNHIIVERYPIESKRAIFMFTEGSQVVIAKKFLLEQAELDHITLEGQTYYGINSDQLKDKDKIKVVYEKEEL